MLAPARPPSSRSGRPAAAVKIAVMAVQSPERPQASPAPIREELAARLDDVEVGLGLARAIRQAGEGRRVRLGVDGLLDLFGLEQLTPDTRRRLDDALAVAGLGVEPPVLDAEPGGTVQVWLVAERFAKEPPDAGATAPASGSAAGGPAAPEGQPDDAALGALLLGAALPVLGTVVLGWPFGAAFVALALVLGALVRWRPAWLLWLRRPIPGIPPGPATRAVTSSFLAASGALFVLSAAAALIAGGPGASAQREAVPAGTRAAQETLAKRLAASEQARVRVEQELARREEADRLQRSRKQRAERLRRDRRARALLRQRAQERQAAAAAQPGSPPPVAPRAAPPPQ